MTENFPRSGRLAGIDFGTVRIGVAISDPARIVSSPYENYTRRGPDADARYFCQLAAAEGLVGFVVGLPVHASGDESQKSREARAFGEWLAAATALPVRFFDERFTSAHAKEILAAANFSKKQRQKRLDMLAAQILLAAFLESSPSAAESPLPLEDDLR